MNTLIIKKEKDLGKLIDKKVAKYILGEKFIIFKFVKNGWNSTCHIAQAKLSVSLFLTAGVKTIDHINKMTFTELQRTYVCGGRKWRTSPFLHAVSHKYFSRNTDSI